jgi:hypothetical protein
MLSVEIAFENLVSWGLPGKSMQRTVVTMAVPNLAKGGKRVEKFFPLSQILAPPGMDPNLGLNSVTVRADCPLVLR